MVVLGFERRAVAWNNVIWRSNQEQSIRLHRRFNQAIFTWLRASTTLAYSSQILLKVSIWREILYRITAGETLKLLVPRCPSIVLNQNYWFTKESLVWFTSVHRTKHKRFESVRESVWIISHVLNRLERFRKRLNPNLQFFNHFLIILKFCFFKLYNSSQKSPSV